ncbi:hypothetical protein [Arthrobacter sp. TMS1-12-1]
MSEERWGEKWHVGDRIRYGHPRRDQIVEGEIKKREWTRIKKKDAYNFTVLADGENETYVIGADRVQPVTDEPLPQAPPAPLRIEPKEETFDPIVSADRKEARKEARKKASQPQDSPEDSEAQAPPTA